MDEIIEQIDSLNGEESNVDQTEDSLKEELQDNLEDETLGDASESDDSAEDDPAEEDDQEEEAEQDIVPKGVEKRINKITAQKKEAEEKYLREKAEAENLKKKLEQYEREKQEAMRGSINSYNPYTNQPMVVPNPDDYESPREYNDALMNFATEYEQLQNKINQEFTQKQQVAKLEEQYEKQKYDLRKKYKDFDEVEKKILSGQVHFSEGMAKGVFNSPKSAEICYWLGKNPDAASKLASLDEVSAIREVMKIENALSKAPPKKSQTKTIVEQETGASSSGKNIDSMSHEELSKFLGY